MDTTCQFISRFLFSKHMEGQINWKKEFKKFLLIVIKLESGDTAKTYVVMGFRNAQNWIDLQVGDKVGGLVWLDEKRKLISADSPVYPLN